MGKLTLTLFGSPRVVHNGRTLKFRSRKELGLLLYLAAEGGMHTRRKLAALFWPESGEKAGRAALRNALAGLQRTLKEGEGNSEDTHLLIERDSLGFDFASECDLDLRLLETASSRTDEERRAVVSGLRSAVEAYGGDFLEGFYLDGAPELDYWLGLERESWRARAGDIHDRLSRLQMEGGELAAAIETSAGWVDIDPSSEAARRRLMEARLASGDRDGAMRDYERYRLLLEERLDASPGAEIEALAIRAGTEARPISASATPPSGSLDLPLVGRSGEFGALVAEYHAVREGRTRAVTIIGEAGIGKTRLSAEFLGWAAAQGGDVLRGRAFETGGGLPYGPVVGALRERMERERAPDDLLPDVWLSELSRLLPELRERYPDLPAPASEEVSAGSRLFEAIARLGGALAERAPVVLFLDDLHWADRASLDVLRYAGGRWAEGGSPVFILAGIRSEAIESDLALAGWLNDLGRDLPVKRISLDALDGEDTTDLLRAMAPEESGGMERLGRWLHDETGGHPFFVVEMIQALFEEGILVAGESVEVAPEELGSLLPSRVREVVRVRFERLEPATRELLTAGAVLGEGFSFEHLHRVAEIGEGEALRAMDEALGSHLLREARRGSGYGFAHDKIGEVVYTEAGDARRRVFHRRALTILEEEGAPPAELARHAFAAGLSEPAFHHSISAGDGAMELFAARDAISHYERSRSLVSDGLAGESPSAAETEHLYVNLGRAREIVGEWDEAEAVYEEMLAHAREEREPSLEWAALNRMAILRGQRFFDMDAAMSLTREALEVAAASGDKAAIAETEWNLTQMAALAWRMDEAFAHAEKALSLARELGLVELEARTLYILGISCLISGRFEETVAYAGRAAELYATVDSRRMRSGTLAAQFVWAGSPPSGPMANRAMEVFCLAVLALGEINRGEPSRAVEAGRKAYEVGREINNDWTRVFGGACLAHGLIELGEYAEAIRICEEVMETARSLPNPIALYFTLFPLIDAHQGIWSLEKARKFCQEALALGDRESMRPYRHVIVSRLCANHALAGDWEEARAYARESVAARDETPVPLTRMDFVRHHETEALLRGGDGERAREDIQRLGEHVGENRRFRLVHLRASAAISRWDNNVEEAIERLGEAALLAGEMGLSGESWQIRAEMGDLHRESGRNKRADEAYAKAAEAVSSIAGKLEDEELREGFLASPQVRRAMERSRR